MKNIELKIKLDSLKHVISLLKKIGARFESKLKQIDTYYQCSNGRIKIREINKNKFELIFYQRPTRKISKISNYRIIELSKKQLPQMKSLLKTVLEQKVIVRKLRLVWIYKHTRIHIDSVSGLGRFLEIETIVVNGYRLARKEHQVVIKMLELTKYRKVSKSYSELLLVND